MKRILALALCMVMMLSNITVSAFESGYAEGVSQWAKNDVRKMHIFNSYRGFVYEDYKASANREEFCQGLISLYNNLTNRGKISAVEKSAERKGKSFEDTDSWAVKRAYELGFVNGTSEKRFSPEKHVTCEEAAVMLKRMFDATGYEAVVDIKEQQPHNQVGSEWARDAIAELWNYKPFGCVLKNDGISLHSGFNREQMIAMFWRIMEDVLGEQKILFYEETTSEILVELGIVDSGDFAKAGFVTQGEAFETFCRFDADKIDFLDFKEWYAIEELKDYDYVDDDKKELILTLMWELVNPILAYCDLEYVDFDRNLTYFDAYLYISRLLMDTSGCVGIEPEQLVRLSEDSAFEIMHEKGLIEEVNTEKANEDIPRKEFYELLHKALFCEFVRGGYIDSVYRYIDGHTAEYNTESKNEDSTISEEITLPNLTVYDDLSVSWDMPTVEGKELKAYTVALLYEDGTRNDIHGSNGKSGIPSMTMIELVVDALPQPPVKIRIEYDVYEDKDGVKVHYEYWDEVDMPEIKFVEGGTAPTPEGAWFFQNQSNLMKMTLGEGETFEEGSYYILKGYEHTYRKEEYNGSSSVIIRADKTSNEFVTESPQMIMVRNREDLHIRKMVVEGSAETGFTVSVTPESEENFQIKNYPEYNF